jgi:hypothetical protein
MNGDSIPLQVMGTQTNNNFLVQLKPTKSYTSIEGILSTKDRALII